MPFLSLDRAWSNLAPYYNSTTNGVFASTTNNPNVTYTSKPQIPRTKYNTFDDGLIRGGVINVGIAAGRDFVRVGNFLKSGKGLLWIAKQVGLQLSNPKLEQLPNATTLSNSNTRLYNLGLNTLTQVPLTALGGHIIRHGVLPVGGIGFLEGDSLNNIKGYNYEKIILDNNKNGKNRLIGYLDKIKDIDASNTNVIQLNSYNGGAASVYGIGKTFITTTTLHTNKATSSTLSYRGVLNYFDDYKTKTSSGYIPDQQNLIAGLRNEAILNRNFANIISSNDINEVNPFTGELLDISNVDRASVDFLSRRAAESEAEAQTREDALNEIINGVADNDFSIFNHLGYRTQNIQQKFGVSTSKYGPNNIKTSHKVDSINVIDVTDSSTFYSNIEQKKSASEVLTDYKDQITGKYGKDIIKFRLEFLNNDTSNLADGSVNTDVLAFRAYIDDFNDGMTAKWNPYRYMGRGEEFFVYEGFTRDISVAFTIYTHSPEEMLPIYSKLNYLLSTFAPDYNTANRMRGNIGYLTVGDYLYRQPGVFTDIKLSGMLDTHWEVGIDKYEGDDGKLYSYAELPKHIKVTLSFKPIHDFLPRRVNSENPSPFISALSE